MITLKVLGVVIVVLGAFWSFSRIFGYFSVLRVFWEVSGRSNDFKGIFLSKKNFILLVRITKISKKPTNTPKPLK